ncbi:MAG: hypothetical protein JNM51_09305 [Bacteroidia bacterium]|nr:hypothetical protein [Bacteroidia bacterium]
MVKEEFYPTEEQIKNGLDMLTQTGIIVESNNTFIHNRTDEYIKHLIASGYDGKLIGVGTNILNYGYMYGIYDPQYFDGNTSKLYMKKYFSMKIKF